MLEKSNFWFSFLLTLILIRVHATETKYWVLFYHFNVKQIKQSPKGSETSLDGYDSRGNMEHQTLVNIVKWAALASKRQSKI